MKIILSISLGCLIFVSNVSAEVCQGFGPQTPRDLTQTTGENPVQFSKAPAHSELNLCNIHFHKNAEHKASGYSLSGGEGKFGGWRCNESESLSKEQLLSTKENHCENVKPGDTIEVHWVHTSCDVEPGEGLGACLSDACANPQLRVETKVFLLSNDSTATDFMTFAEGAEVNGYHQAKALPERSDALEFLGSTTCLLYTSPSPRDATLSRMPSSA